MKAILTAVLLLAATCASVSAQNTTPQTPATPTDTEVNPRFWDARFANGGNYLVKLDRISFASKHEYVGNGAARVVEVTLGNDTSVVARFYWLEPLGKDTPIAAGAIVLNRAEQVVKDVSARTSPSAGRLQVIKDYPNTTHSHTVEYALQTPEALNSLYDSLIGAIKNGRGRIWRESGN